MEQFMLMLLLKRYEKDASEYGLAGRRRVIGECGVGSDAIRGYDGITRAAVGTHANAAISAILSSMQPSETRS